MPDELLTNDDPRREPLLDAIEAYVIPFGCHLVQDQLDEGCWHVVDVTSDFVVIAEIRDLEEFALANGIALPR